MEQETSEGININELILLIQDPWNEESPLQLIKGSNKDYENIPILNQVKLFASILENKNEVTLTKKGFLPTSIVKDLYFNGYLQNRLIDDGLIKVYKEADCEQIYFTRLICQLNGIIKKSKNKISLTTKGRDLIKSDHKLFEELFKTVTQKFNLSFFDGYECELTGQYGIIVTIYLINKYGQISHTPNFYAKKYIKLIPGIYDNFPQPNYSTKLEVFTDCYASRTFTRSLNYFGLLEVDMKSFYEIGGVAKSDVFNKLINFNYKLPFYKMN